MILHNIAVVGASGLVGRKILQVLDERKFPYGKLVTIASEASYGKEISVGKHLYKLQKITHDIFKGHEIVFFSAGGAVSHEYAPLFAKEKAVVIDNSSAFRMNEDIPLVVPEVNRQEIFKNKGLISNPNCSTIQLVVVLKPLDNMFKIKRVIVSTYQSVSGAGNKGVIALQEEIKEPGKRAKNSIFPHRIAYNAIPQVDIFFEDGYTKEEHKMMNETRKILGIKNLNITATCIRIPSLVGHGESVNIEFEKKFTIEEVRKVLAGSTGITVIDEPRQSEYPMPIDSAETDDVYVGRIRHDASVRNGLNLWIVSDNLRKGAATNAVQIAEELIKGK